MRRRDFFEMGAALAAAQTQATAAPPAQRASRARMKLGTQHGDSDEILRTMAAFGVNHICSTHAVASSSTRSWSVDALKRLRERIEEVRHHSSICCELPTNSSITTSGIKNVMLGKSPGARSRDRRHLPDDPQHRAGRAFRVLKYNLTILAVVRTEPTPGRGGAMYSTFDYAKAQEDPPLTEAGPVSAEAHWERITYFLDRVVPVAQEYKVKIACHPHDPAMPGDKAYRGVHRVMGSVEGLKRFVSIQGESVSRAELLPGHGERDARQARRADLRRDPLFRRAQEDLQRALPQYQGALPEIPGDLSG